ncbi:MAG TPA: ABC transporter permease [Galbitalea sp.]|jgi:D-xylose transport system permease protein
MSTASDSTIQQRFRPRGGLSNYAVIIGLALVWVVFQLLSDNFLSSRNLSNLVLQIAVLGTLSVGMVMVLIIGEIDLSVGAIAGVAAGSMAVLVSILHYPAWVSIVAALVIGALIGLLHGTIITAIGIPSFIVTLAGLLIWEGVQLAIVGDGGQIGISNLFIQSIASTYVPIPLGWVFAALIWAGITVFVSVRRRRRMRSGLTALSVTAYVLTLAIVAVVVAGVTLLLNSYLGIPWVLVLLLVLVFGFTVVMSETPFGRHMYAIGGNREAARRSGIKVRTITVFVFVMISTIAAVAGIIEASREFSASNALGGGTLQLDAIAAAVIGGTSLFGGRGKIYHALLGALVVGSVENGLDLLGQPAAVKNVATGLILLLAISVDAISRRRRLARGAAS